MFDSLDRTNLLFNSFTCLCGLAMMLPICSFDHFGWLLISLFFCAKLYCVLGLLTDGRSARDHFGSTDVSGLHFVPRDSHSRNWSLSVFGVFCLLGADLNKTLFLKYLCVMTKLFFAFTQALFQPRIISSQGFFPASLLFQPGV